MVYEMNVKSEFLKHVSCLIWIEHPSLTNWSQITTFLQNYRSYDAFNLLRYGKSTLLNNLLSYDAFNLLRYGKSTLLNNLLKFAFM